MHVYVADWILRLPCIFICTVAHILTGFLALADVHGYYMQSKLGSKQTTTCACRSVIKSNAYSCLRA